MAGIVWGCGCATGPVPAARRSLELTYLGVAGWKLTDGEHVVLVDPYFSRPADTHHPKTDEAAVAAHAPPRADLILIGHAHFDHALDAAAVSLRTGALVVGSAELAGTLRASGVSEGRIRTVSGGEWIRLPGVAVRVVPSKHSLIGPENGEDVQTFAYFIQMGGEEFLVMDTPNYIAEELEKVRPAFVIAANGSWQKQLPDYTCGLMRALGQPKLVIATHFDDFKKPAGLPLTQGALEELRGFEAEIRRCSPGSRLLIPKAFEPFR